MKDFLQISKERYTTKHYDSSKKISNADFQKLLEILRLAPSAVNVQPWFFYTGSSKEAKDTIIKANPEFNIPRIQGCSHFVVLCARTKLEDEYLRSVTAKESADGRYSEDRIRDAVDEHRRLFSNMHVELGDFNEWTARQTYIAMAALLYGAASMGIDSTPIEGMDYSKCDEILNLKEKNLRSVAIVTLGYRASDDSNASRPKSRLELEDIVQNID